MSANVSETVNGTYSRSSCINPTALRIGGTFVFCLIFVVSLIGNAFVGIVVYRNKTLRKPINFFIVNMAMSDLLYPIFFFPPNIALSFTSNSWLISGLLGHALCKLVHFFTKVSMYVSVQSLVLIAVDRFVAVVFPLRSPLISSKQCRYFTLATWIIAVAFRCPGLIANKLVENQGAQKCRGDWNYVFGDTFSLKFFKVAIYVLFVYLPLVLIAILYVIIAIKLKSQETPGEQSTNARKLRLKKERNVLKMSVAIVLVSLLCLMPFSMLWFLENFSSNTTMISSCNFQYFWYIAYFLAVSNCAINPCICFIFSANYRQGLKNLLNCFLC